MNPAKPREVRNRTWQCALFAVAGLLWLGAGPLNAAAPAPPDRGRAVSDGQLAANVRPTLRELLQRIRERAAPILAGLDAEISPEAKLALAQYIAKPGPGVTREKALGDFAASAGLSGETKLATWAALVALQTNCTSETVANAGIYLVHLGRLDDALQFLTCARDTGFPSPYVFEALAVVHHKLGDATNAHAAIRQAQRLAPDDVLIETEASFVTSGGPPPPRPPAPPGADGLDEAVRELEQHADRVISQVKTQTDVVQRCAPDGQAAQFYAIAAEYCRNLIQIARDQVRPARAADAQSRPMMINGVLGTCIHGYAQITDTLLSLPDTLDTSGGQILFWAEVMRLDPEALAREGGPREGAVWGMHSFHGPALTQAAYEEYFGAKDPAYHEYNAREHACADDACVIREQARWCGIWKQLFDRWAEKTRQRHDAAARAFDRVATRTLLAAENEVLQARDYAVRHVAKTRFTRLPGYDVRQMMLQGGNESLRFVWEKHLNPPADESSGTVGQIRELARWFTDERAGAEEILAGGAQQIQSTCEPVLRAFFELFAQEEWEAYRDHLRDRLAWDLQGQAETSEFPCEGSFGPITITTDLNKPGEGKLDLKWKPTKKLAITGSGTIRQDQTFGVSVTAAGTGSIPGVEGSTASGSVFATDSNVGLGGGVSYGPFAGKGKVTLTTKVSPWDSHEYLGIKLKGSAGLGLKRGSMSAACFPSSGSVTIYPRAFVEDAMTYLSTPTSRPR